MKPYRCGHVLFSINVDQLVDLVDQRKRRCAFILPFQHFKYGGISKKTETNARIRNGSTAAQKDRCRVLDTFILRHYTEFHREWCTWTCIVIVCVKPVDEKYAVKWILTNKNDTPSSGTRSNSFMRKAICASRHWERCRGCMATMLYHEQQWWYDLFARGRDSAKLKGGPSTLCRATTKVLTNTCTALLAEDASMTLHELKDVLQILYGSTQSIVKKKLGYSRVCAKWFPKILTLEQKAERVRIAQLWEKKLPRTRQGLIKWWQQTNLGPMCTTHWPNSRADIGWNEEVIHQRNRKVNGCRWKCRSSHFLIRTVSSTSRRCSRRSINVTQDMYRKTLEKLENVQITGRESGNCIWTTRGLIKQNPYPISWLVGGWGRSSSSLQPRSRTVGLFPASEDEATAAWKAVSRSQGNYEFSTYKFSEDIRKMGYNMCSSSGGTEGKNALGWAGNMSNVKNWKVTILNKLLFFKHLFQSFLISLRM